MKSPKSLTVVIKLGTSSIVHEKTHEPRLATLSVIVETVVKLRRDGHRVVLVSSGAIGVALQLMDLETRPKSLPQVQALAALGQCRLMGLWDMLFMRLKQPVAQILLTRNDIADRTQYLNAQNTINELLNMGVIPIVNENDTLSVAEIKFGDNDTLSAITAAMLSADYLFLMTDVDCLYTSNPRIDPNAKPIPVVSDISALEADVSSAGSSLGTGGMSTKIVAAKLGTAAGVTTIITQASKPGNVAEIVDHLEALKAAGTAAALSGGQTASEKAEDAVNITPKPPLAPAIPPAPLHTRFLPSLMPIRDRSFWLLHDLTPRGVLYIDKGAHRALRAKAGLLPVGIVGVEGNFAQQEAVRLVVVARDWKVDPTSPNEGSRSHPSSRPSSPSPARPAQPTGSEGHSSESDHGNTTPIYDQMTSIPPGRGELLPATATLPHEVGRALVNYAAPEIAHIKGLQSKEIERMLGYADSEYVALRENISLFDGKEGGSSRGRKHQHKQSNSKEIPLRPGLGQ